MTWITISHYADQFSISKQAVYEKIKNQRLPSKKNDSGRLLVGITDQSNNQEPFSKKSEFQKEISNTITEIQKTQSDVTAKLNQLLDVKEEKNDDAIKLAKELVDHFLTSADNPFINIIVNIMKEREAKILKEKNLQIDQHLKEIEYLRTKLDEKEKLLFKKKGLLK